LAIVLLLVLVLERKGGRVVRHLIPGNRTRQPLAATLNRRKPLVLIEDEDEEEDEDGHGHEGPSRAR
jgi:hypothetical protein